MSSLQKPGRKKWYYGISFLFFVVIILFCITAPKIETFHSKKTKPDFLFENVKMYQIDNGKTIWEIASEQAKIYKDQNKAFLVNIKCKMFQNKKVISNIKSPQAHIRLDNSDLELWHPLAKFNINQDIVLVKAKKLLWYAQPQTFIGDQDIYISSGPIEIFGDHLKVNLKRKTIKIKKNCLAFIKD
jgi:LPS export ABC transporter protein LptC